MNSAVTINGLTVVALGVLLAIAVWNDIKFHRISNFLVVDIILLGLLSQLLVGGAEGVVTGIAGMAVGLGLFLPFYIGGGMGAGDVKLLAGIGSILGPLSTLFAGGIALLVGMPLAVVYMLRRHYRLKNLAENSENENKKLPSDFVAHLGRQEKLPYAVAIATGAVVGLWHSGQLGTFIGAIS